MLPNESPGFDEVAALARAMRALARHLVADASLADDVVQDAWVTALERPPSATQSMRAWLLRVVRSRAIDLERSTARRARREQRAAAVEPDPGPGIADRFAVQADVLAAVRALREPYREAVYLRYWTGLGPQRIAVQLGVPTKTVKTWLARALVMLRGSLDDRRGRGGWVPALAAGSTKVLAGGLGGVMAMETKKIVLGAGALVLAAGIWTFGRGSLDGQSMGTRPETPSAVAADATDHLASDTGTGRHPASHPASAPAHPETGGALRVQSVWHDGTKAPRIAIICCAEADPAKELNTVRVITDDSGIAVVRDLRPGTMVLESDRGGRLETDVGAGIERNVRFVIPPGIDVEGLVTDARGVPVPGAGIWLTTGKDGWLGGRVVATSGPAGTFVVQAVDQTQSLGALAAGFAPSELVDLDLVDQSAVPARVTLELRRKGAAVLGRVTDELGAPVAGALVALGRPGSAVSRLNQTRHEIWTPIVCETDDSGEFACATVAPGKVPITVRSAGFALSFAQAVCREGGETRVDIVLRRPTTVEGTAIDDGGTPVDGVRVLVVDGVFRDWGFNVSGSQSAFGRPTAISEASGYYRLPGVAPGEVQLVAHKGTRSLRDPYRGRADTVLHVVAGETSRWDPRISRGLLIRGRLETAGGGKPGSFSPIHAVPEREGSRVLTTSATLECRFEFTNCDDVPYTVVVGDLAGRTEPTLTPGVRPGGVELVITLPREEPVAPARVRGRVVDAARRLPTPAALGVSLRSTGFSVPVQVEGDRFSVSGVEPGRYRVIVASGGQVVHAGAWFELAPGEEHDLGDVPTEPGGGLVVRPVWPAGREPLRPSASLLGAEGQSLTWDGRVFRGEGLYPRRCELTLHADGLFAPKRDVEIVAGETREVEVPMFPGVAVPLELRAPTRADWKRIEVRVLDNSGKAVWTWSVRNRVGYVWPMQRAATLAPGAYTLEAESDHGMRARMDFGLRDLHADVGPIVVTLRR